MDEWLQTIKLEQISRAVLQEIWENLENIKRSRWRYRVRGRGLPNVKQDW
jgi:hypothetical protein